MTFINNELKTVTRGDAIWVYEWYAF